MVKLCKRSIFKSRQCKVHLTDVPMMHVLFYSEGIRAATAVGGKKAVPGSVCVCVLFCTFCQKVECQTGGARGVSGSLMMLPALLSDSWCKHCPLEVVVSQSLSALP